VQRLFQLSRLAQEDKQDQYPHSSPKEGVVSKEMFGYGHGVPLWNSNAISSQFLVLSFEF